MLYLQLELHAIFESLDFLYVPAPGIYYSINYYQNILGGKLLWKFMLMGFGWHVSC
jgi:hypothetical protein